MATESNTSNPRIIHITACTSKGERRDFANVYGLDEQSRVWQWDPTKARWRAFKFEASNRSRDGF